jgi:hypothetical protein
MLNDQNIKDYFNGRLAAEAKREKTWRYLTKYYFNKKIKSTDLIVEIGAGWCDFINNITCERRYASDIWDGVLTNADSNVKAYVSDASDFAFLKEEKADVIFASNIFEHLSRDKLDEVIDSILINLNNSGKLIVLQPNFRLNPGRYFDDYTHVSIWTDVSMCAYLEAKGMKIQTCKPKFLPLTVKSKFPVFGFLIKLYLIFPIKFQAGQMLIIATKNHPLQS